MAPDWKSVEAATKEVSSALDNISGFFEGAAGKKGKAAKAGFAAASDAAGLLGSAFALYNLFSGDTDPVLDGLQKLSNKIDSLEKTVRQEFDQLLADVKMDHARLAIWDHINSLETYRRLLVTERKACPKGKGISGITTISEIQPVDVLHSMGALSSLMEGDNLLSINALDRIYDASHGGVEVARTAQYLGDYLLCGSIILSAIEAAKVRRGNNAEGEGSSAQAEAAKLANRVGKNYLESADKAIDKILDKCEKHLPTNAKSRVEAINFSAQSANSTDCYGPIANKVLTEITSAYPWREWGVTCAWPYHDGVEHVFSDAISWIKPFADAEATITLMNVDKASSGNRQSAINGIVRVLDQKPEWYTNLQTLHKAAAPCMTKGFVAFFSKETGAISAVSKRLDLDEKTGLYKASPSARFLCHDFHGFYVVGFAK